VAPHEPEAHIIARYIEAAEGDPEEAAFALMEDDKMLGYTLAIAGRKCRDIWKDMVRDPDELYALMRRRLEGGQTPWTITNDLWTRGISGLSKTTLFHHARDIQAAIWEEQSVDFDALYERLSMGEVLQVDQHVGAELMRRAADAGTLLSSRSWVELRLATR
jgi:hypothetical protein